MGGRRAWWESQSADSYRQVRSLCLLNITSQPRAAYVRRVRNIALLGLFRGRELTVKHCHHSRSHPQPHLASLPVKYLHTGLGSEQGP